MYFQPSAAEFVRVSHLVDEREMIGAVVVAVVVIVIATVLVESTVSAHDVLGDGVVSVFDLVDANMSMVGVSVSAPPRRVGE